MADTGASLERDVALRIRPASGTVFRQDADSPGQFHPPWRTHGKRIAARFRQKGVEFDPFKRGVV